VNRALQARLAGQPSEHARSQRLLNRQAGSMGAAMNNKLSKLSADDRAKLDALVNDCARDGRKAIRRFAEADPLAYVRIAAALQPRLVAKHVEDDLLDTGLTNADLRAMAANAMSRH
jgi:hypothetical protein